MGYIKRSIEMPLRAALKRQKSVLLLGSRQTGKTTLLNQLKADLIISFIKPDIRQRYEKNPSLLSGQVEEGLAQKSSKKPLIFLDEIQKVPDILDVAQDLIDRNKAVFVLTGSSARKLRRNVNINLLPGRVVSLKLDPFTFKEFPSSDLSHLLLYGALPSIIQLENDEDKETDLASYVTTYLEEEIRSEAIVRNVASFSRFLEYACSESGQVVNFRKLSQEIGVAHTTIADYYQILDDCFIAERVEPLTKSKTRKKLTKSQKYLIFDLGVRRLGAEEGIRLSRDKMGHLFEQFVGLELIRMARLSKGRNRVFFWRDPSGPEVDWIVEQDNQYIPIEVKWTDTPGASDTKHMDIFLREYSNSKKGYIVCRTPTRYQIKKNIIAIPWQDLPSLFD